MSDNGHTRLSDDGVATAEEVFGRVHMQFPADAPTTNGNGNGNGHAAPKASRVRLTQVRSAAARTLDLYGELFQRAFETYADLAQAAMQPDTDPAPGTPLTLSGPVGGEATTPLWLHNLSGATVREVTLFVTDLSSAGGGRIEAGAACLLPTELELLAGATASAVLHIAIPPAAAPGVYHGHVLSAQLPASALGVRLEVEP